MTATLHQYLLKKNEQLQDVELRIAIYYSGEDFLHEVGQGRLFHIVFMDIQMGGMDGVETGKILRNTPDGDDVILIYMSSHNSYFEGIARVGGFRFLEKPAKLSELDDVFSRALKSVLKGISNQSKMFQYKVNKDIFFVKAAEIAYLKSDDKAVEIYIFQRNEKSLFLLERVYSSITASAEQLSADYFIQCERSHIVNFNFVQRMAGTAFILMDTMSTQVPIGRAYKEKVRKAYTTYRRSQYE